MTFHDAIQLALAECTFFWVGQVFKCFSSLSEPVPLSAAAPVTIAIKTLQELFMRGKL